MVKRISSTARLASKHACTTHWLRDIGPVLTLSMPRFPHIKMETVIFVPIPLGYSIFKWIISHKGLSTDSGSSKSRCMLTALSLCLFQHVPRSPRPARRGWAPESVPSSKYRPLPFLCSDFSPRWFGDRGSLCHHPGHWSHRFGCIFLLSTKPQNNWLPAL